VKADLAFRPPPAVRLALLAPLMRPPQAAVASCSIISLSVSSPEARQKRSKLADRLARASAFSACVGIAVDVVCFFMALLSFRGISTPSLLAQGEQRRSSFFNIPRDIPNRRGM